MEFRAFAERAAEIEATEADLEVVALTAELLEAAGEDLAVVARFVQGRVFPAWSSRTLDVGPSLCYEALARAAGPNVGVEDVEERLAEQGDVGAVAASLDLEGQAGLDAFGGGAGAGSGGATGADSGGAGADAGGEGGSERTVGDVYAELDDLAAAAGSGSQDRKLDLLFGLFSNSTAEEARYLSRLVLGEMRIGVGEGTVRDAIATAFEVPEGEVERALQVTNDYGLVAERARERGADALAELRLEVGRPVQAMLAQAGTVADALEDWDAALVETKLDGARVQVHYREDHDWPDRGGADDRSSAPVAAGLGADADAGTDVAEQPPPVRLFSRNMEDVTGALPELVTFVAEVCEPPAILDGEVVAVDEDGEVLPFQEVLRRFRRKHDVDAAREDVATELHLFDCLHVPAELRDEVDVPEPFAGSSESADATADADGDDAQGQRDLTAFGAGEDPDSADEGATVEGADAADAATDPVRESEGGLDLVDAPLRTRRAYLEALLEDGVVAATVTDDADEIEAEEQRALEAGHEGIMLKNPASAYTPGRRGKDWLKRKPDVETLDLVVTGAEWGEGRRAELFGTFELGARVDDGFATVGNVATGLTDEELAELHERLEPHVEREEGQTVTLEPAVVFEVGYEEIQTSPTYDSGYALRFPRFVAVRDDLDPDEADALERVERLAGE